MIKIPAYLDTFSSKSDKTAGIRFSTQELQDEDFTLLRQHQGLFGWLVFSEEQVQERDLPKEKLEDKSKTPSKRYRAVKFLEFSQKGGKKADFNLWYDRHMEKIIDEVKERLND